MSEALIAAKLSRSLERPRHETDGRFARGVALAARHGTRRQQFEARYEVIWTCSDPREVARSLSSIRLQPRSGDMGIRP